MKKETVTVISVFIFGCVWGYCFEVLLLLARGKGFVNRGYLLGPYLPVYGFGLLLCWFISRLLKKYEPLKCCLLVRIFIEVLVFFVLATLLEFITGIFLEWVFHRRWWDYSGNFMNINGLVCLESSLIFAFVSIFLVRAVIPQLVKGSEKLSLSKHKPVLVIVLAIMFIDFIFSTILHFLNIN